MPIFIRAFVAVVVATVIPIAMHGRARRPVVAVFAHPMTSALSARFSRGLRREGRETHLVIATDGAKGVAISRRSRQEPELAAVRVKEANCAATRLGVRKLHLLGLPDGGLASFDELGKLRSGLAAIIDSLNPCGDNHVRSGGSHGHPDTAGGNVGFRSCRAMRVTRKLDLLYASLPSERCAPRRVQAQP